MSETVTLKSGRTLVLNTAPFAVGRKLLKQVALELRAVNVDVTNLDLNLEVGSLMQDPRALTTIKNLFCQLIASDEIETAMFECAARCTIDSQKINRDAFEAPDMRGDFLPVAWEVIRHNLTPFFANLSLSSLASGVAPKSAPQ